MIIGELINSSRKAVRPLIAERDAQAICEVAAAQVKAGADYIDLNCGTFLEEEPERLRWLVETVRQAVDAPLSLDSPNPQALASALPAAGQQMLINSISAEKERFRALLPLILEYRAKVVALCMADGEIAQTAEDRVMIGGRLIEDLTAAGVALDDIYLDPLVQPLSVSEAGAGVITETVRRIRQLYPGVHTVCGLSNISFGLPNRKLINRYFLAQAISAGMDSFILDPTDQKLMGAYYASRALAGQDRFCGQYLKAHRRGLYSGE